MRRVFFLSFCLLIHGASGSAAEFRLREVQRIVTGPALVDPFRRPMGLAIDPVRGILAIGDTGNHRLVLFDARGRGRGSIYWSAVGLEGAGEPKCVALDRRGRLFVLDASAGRIEVLSASGSRLGLLQPQLPPDVAAGVRPQFIAAGASGRLYVLYGGERAGLVVVEPNGATRGTIGFETPESALLQG